MQWSKGCDSQTKIDENFTNHLLNTKHTPLTL